MYGINLITARTCIGTSEPTKHDIHMFFGELAIDWC
jgi:hypothetical protein